jgi:probable phosphoglycerate mutase
VVTLHLVRHGDTRAALESIFCGDLDPPLTDTGQSQAEALARALEPLKPVALYCSPKLRARQTAEPIARACALVPGIEPDLREISYGAWDGLKEADVRVAEPEAHAAWVTDPGIASPPGGESGHAIAARALPVVRRAVSLHASGHVVMVSHKATIRVLACALLGIPLGRYRSHIACPTASITSFEVTPAAATIVRVADVHHLAV